MFKTYFYLNRAIIELNEKIGGLTIEEVFSQDKNKLNFSIGNNEFPYQHLMISTDQLAPSFQIKKDLRKARKNTFSFFETLLPDKIEMIEIAETDRVIKFSLSKSNLYFLIRGNQTNIIAIKNNEIFSYKKLITEKEKIFDIINSLDFTSNAVIPSIDAELINNLEFKEIKNIDSRITREIFNETISRLKNDSIEEFCQTIPNVFLEFHSNKIATFYSTITGKPIFCPDSFALAINEKEKDISENYLQAIYTYYSKKYKTENIENISLDIKKYLDKELSKLSNKLNNLKKRIDDGSKEELYKNYGNLLLVNIHLLENKMSSIVVNDYTTNENVEIKLNNKIAAKKNVDYYFDKSRDEKINYKVSMELFLAAKKTYNFLLECNKEFEDAVSVDDYKKIKEKLNIKERNKNGNKLEDKIKFRHYLLEGKYHIYVGRDSKNNDLLSTKFVKQNDYWFHVRGLPGSHVVLRNENTKEVIPKSVLKDTACLTAFFSKAKTAGTAPVAYTFGKFVFKKKGMLPGQVIVQKEKVLLVKPGIPATAELLEE